MIFDQKGARFPGFQVPAGSLEAGEEPSAGALREAIEEAGLEQLSLVGLLGEAQRDMRDYGFDQIHQRYFFHIRCEQPTPATWRHTYPDPSLVSEEMPLLPFDFQWVRMPDKVPHLLADFGYHLPSLYQTLGIKDQA